VGPYDTPQRRAIYARLKEAPIRVVEGLGDWVLSRCCPAAEARAWVMRPEVWRRQLPDDCAPTGNGCYPCWVLLLLQLRLLGQQPPDQTLTRPTRDAPFEAVGGGVINAYSGEIR
jgi:hypothetical protein